MNSIMAKWEELPIADRAQYMRVAVQNGYRDIRSIREAYNRFDEGGDLDGGYLPEVTVLANPKPYNTFLQTLPPNLKNTKETEYRMHRYWELHDKPQNFIEAVNKGMFSKQSDGYYHANSVAKNKETGDYEFMKYPNHPTINMELDWYYSKEGKDFRRDYRLDTTSNPYYTYTRKSK